MRVVLDTNILVSALIFPGGKPEAVYRQAFDRSIELVASAVLLAECEGMANHIVSGDRHLLALGVYDGVRILDATTFLSEAKGDPPHDDPTGVL